MAACQAAREVPLCRAVGSRVQNPGPLCIAHYVCAPVQPIDAIAAVMDGGLLGASETDWVARASIVISLACLIGLFFAKRAFPTSLLALWGAMKVPPPLVAK